MLKLAVIIVNWRSATLVLDNAAALRRSDYENVHLFVVDNASGDDSLQRLSALGPSATLIANPANNGWAGGCNLAVARARAAGFEAFFLLNPDAAVRPETLRHLAEASARLGARTVLGCVSYNGDGQLQYRGDRQDDRTGQPVWLGTTATELNSGPEFIESFLVVGSAMLIRAELWDEVGSFDESYFLYFEEYDWGMRARRSGARFVIVRDAVIDHVGGATVGGYGSPFFRYLFIRNRLRFSRRYGSAKQVSRMVAFAMTAQVGACLLRLTRERTTRSWMLLVAQCLAVWHFLIGRSGDAPPALRRTLS